MNVKLLFLIFLASLLFSLVLFPLREGFHSIFFITGFPPGYIVGFIIQGVWTTLCIHRFRKKCKPVYLLFAILLGVFIFDLSVRLGGFSSATGSFLDMLIWYLSIICGYFVAKIAQKKYRISLIVIALLTGTSFSVSGYNLFLHYLNFGSLKGNVYEKLSYPLSVQNSDGKTIDGKDLYKDYLVLDFWNSTCGVCFRDFPKVQELYDKLKNDQQVSFYSIHCRRGDEGETFETGQHILQKRNYSFPSVSIDIKSPILDTLGVKCYPTVIIIDSNRNIIFRGNIDMATNKILELTYEMH